MSFGRALLCMLLVAASPSLCHAQGWMFRRSYYTHVNARPVQIGPRTGSGPAYTRPVGDYVRSGYRHINSRVVVGGMSVDHINAWESWVQVGGQY